MEELRLMSDEEYERPFTHKGTKTIELSDILCSELCLRDKVIKLPYGIKAEKEEIEKYKDQIRELNERDEFCMVIRHDFYTRREEMSQRESVVKKIVEQRPQEANRYDFVGTSSSQLNIDEKGRIRVHFYKL